MRGRALLGTLVLGAALLTPVTSAQAFTPGSTICHGGQSERLFLSVRNSGTTSNVRRGRCISNADEFYVARGCRALVNLTAWREGGTWQDVNPYSYYAVLIDCP